MANSKGPKHGASQRPTERASHRCECCGPVICSEWVFEMQCLACGHYGFLLPRSDIRTWLRNDQRMLELCAEAERLEKAAGIALEVWVVGAKSATRVAAGCLCSRTSWTGLADNFPPGAP